MTGQAEALTMALKAACCCPVMLNNIWKGNMLPNDVQHG
jgi:hypothetical protein